MTAFRQVWAGAVRGFCVLALLSLAFAHQPPRVMAATLEAASLQLPDGGFADLCISEAPVKHPAAAPLCEACRLCAAVLLPAPDGDSWLIRFFASLSNVRQPAVRVAIAAPHERARARGPPILC